MQNVISGARKKIPVYACFILFSVILVVMFTSISQLDMVTADQSYFQSTVKTISNKTMAGMSSNMSGMHDMLGMSSNMSGMHGMSGMSSNMSGMHDMLGISSNEETSVFLELMGIVIVGLIVIPFAWVFISERRKKRNHSNTEPKHDVDKK